MFRWVCSQGVLPREQALLVFEHKGLYCGTLVGMVESLSKEIAELEAQMARLIREDRRLRS